MTLGSALRRLLADDSPNTQVPEARNAEQLYLTLLKRSLVDLLGPTTTRAEPQADGSVRVQQVPEQERHDRSVGRDWPANGATMIGLKRLDNLERCIETLIADEVPGDLIETGVWRGGAAIFTRALLDLRGQRDRRLWAADSFAGLPPPDPGRYPSDEHDRHHTVDFLAVPLGEVKRNFERYDVGVDGVRFLQGWFQDTLPTLDQERWSLIRLDGDMYESTMVGLESLYPGLASGGFLIVDDYGAVAGCRRAVEDFRARDGMREPLEQVDWTGVYWRKR